MIYLDHNATSPMLGEVRDAMEPWWGRPANPASVHRAGQAAAVAVEQARAQVAALVGGNPAGVVFTGGATEANHLIIRGAASRLGAEQSIAVSAVEHPCVRGAAELTGLPVDVIGVDRDGAIRVADIPQRVGLVSVMAANHETGVIHDIAAVSARARETGAFVHVDAVQAAARLDMDFSGVHAVVMSAHKMGGPPGVGCAVLTDGDPFPALLTGGAQERGRRAGTVNVAGVVGFGAACAVALRDRAVRSDHSERLASRLRAGLNALGARQIGWASRLHAVTCVVFPGVAGEAVVQALDLRGICVSHGAACSSGSLDPSPVLLAMADPDPRGGVRFSTGPSTTQADIDATLSALGELVPLLVDAWDE